MSVDNAYKPGGLNTSKFHRYAYRLMRAGRNRFSPSVKSETLLSGHISTGDPVVLSIEGELLAVSRGFVLELGPDHVILGLDHALSGASIVYRIDKDEFTAGMARIRHNLAQLFYADGDERRRRLVVDLEKPRFTSAFSLESLSPALPGLDSLNRDQRQAIVKTLNAQDYALILGMPGTGKTTTISALINALTACGKSILLTSYTHSAVDNILLTIKDSNITILRLGNVDKVNNVQLKHRLLNGLTTSSGHAQFATPYPWGSKPFNVIGTSRRAVPQASSYRYYCFDH